MAPSRPSSRPRTSTRSTGRSIASGSGDTAWSQRNVRFAQVVLGADGDPANAGDGPGLGGRLFGDDIRPYSAGGAYMNFIMDEGQERVRETYRDNYDRLARIKARYDPNEPLPRQPEHPARLSGDRTKPAGRGARRAVGRGDRGNRRDPLDDCASDPCA